MGAAVVLLANVFFGGVGNVRIWGVVNVRILGVVNVLLANNSQSIKSIKSFSYQMYEVSQICVISDLIYQV